MSQSFTLKINCKEKGEEKEWDVNGPNMQSKARHDDGPHMGHSDPV